MDEGILSRLVLDTLPPLDTLLERLDLHLTPAAGNQLRTVLTTTGATGATGTVLAAKP
jgi:hypothetical protein